jgi:hypothetical protein
MLPKGCRADPLVIGGARRCTCVLAWPRRRTRRHHRSPGRKRVRWASPPACTSHLAQGAARRHSAARRAVEAAISARNANARAARRRAPPALRARGARADASSQTAPRSRRCSQCRSARALPVQKGHPALTASRTARGASRTARGARSAIATAACDSASPRSSARRRGARDGDADVSTRSACRSRAALQRLGMVTITK